MLDYLHSRFIQKLDDVLTQRASNNSDEPSRYHVPAPVMSAEPQDVLDAVSVEAGDFLTVFRLDHPERVVVPMVSS